MAGLNENLVAYFLDDKNHPLKRIFWGIAVVLALLLVDYYTGFTKFHYIQAKNQTLKELAATINDPKTSAYHRQLLMEDYDRIAQEEPLAVEIENHFKPESQKIIQRKTWTDRIVEYANFPFIVFFLSSGWAFYLFGIFNIISVLVFDGNRKIISLAMGYLGAGLFCGIICFLLPPYSFTSSFRYMMNLCYGFVFFAIYISIVRSGGFEKWWREQ